MAIPTITSISPTSGLTKGGNILQINGTNFRIAPLPPAVGYLGGDAQQTVSVLFEGVRAEWAEAASDTLILTRVPQWAGAYDALPLDLDVRVANLDDSGVEIPTENATLADAYTIDRTKLTTESVLQKVCREAVSVFRRHLLQNTHITMSRDFDETIATLERKVAEAPVVYLIGPNSPTNRLRSCNHLDPRDDPANPGMFVRNEVPITVDLNFEIRIYAVGSQHTISLQQALILMFRDVTSLIVGDQIPEFRMPFNRYPTITNVPNQSDLYSIRSGMSIKGVHLDEESGTIIERGWDVDDFEVDIQNV